MQGKFKEYIRNLELQIQQIISKEQSAIILGPRQTGKTTTVKKCVWITFSWLYKSQKQVHQPSARQ